MNGTLNINMDRQDWAYELMQKLDQRLTELDRHSAVHAEKMSQVANHLQMMNGRIAKSEQRLGSLETIRAEVKGGYKAVVAVASAVGAIASWVVSHWPK
jgi:septal ring factor EnvC (AmiA/AmiB activator)